MKSHVFAANRARVRDFSPELMPRGLRIAIAAPQVELFDNVAYSLADELLKLGHAPCLLRDGDHAALECDHLVLVGMGTNFPRYGRLLPKAPKRPRVLMWQHEPLPPKISPELIALAERHAAPCWSYLLGRWAQPLDPLVGMPGFLKRRVRDQLGLAAERLILSHESRQAQLHPVGLRLMLEQLPWYRSACQGPNRWIDRSACSVATRVQALADLGAPADFIPLGYHPIWGEELPGERDIDVLFIGRLNGAARNQALERVAEPLRKRGHVVHVQSEGCFGDQRTALVSRARVVLNLLGFPWEFPGMRLLFSIGCGAVVVSESCGDTQPWVPGVHFVPATVETMPEVIAGLLANEPRRRAFAHSARTAMLRENSAQRMAEQVLALLSARSARAA